ncbi:MAG: MBL fold metallo-hydrolase [Candidatus Aenigmarchaeota archaeon]|nr:MBL fold metallo-hydrolase [Candidatus Aenigmarchaeota archaeon]
MIIDFLGGCREIGREAFLVRDKNTNVLLEFGVELQPNIRIPPLPTVRLNGLFVTHAHLDHSGMVPLIYKTQSPPLYVTPPTLDLMNLLLEDYVKVAKLTRGFGEYTNYDIAKMNKHAKPQPYNQRFTVGNLSCKLFDACHIPGSASVYLEGSKKLMYTGDINTVETNMLSYNKITYPKLDCLITESTYSEKDHPDRKIEEKRFIDKVCEYEHGVVLLPSFAVGRSQELLLMLWENGIKNKIYFDGMGQKAADLILYHKNYIKDATLLKNVLKNITFVRTRKQRDKVVRDGGIVVTTSGMLNGGPVMHYLQKVRDMKEACLLLTGYQAEGTPGEKLLRTGVFENEEHKFDVNLEVQKYDFSGHAGKKELFSLVERIAPEKVICVHGSNTQKFAKEIKNKLNIEALAPEAGESVEI